jgi:hypothetical protein
MSTKSRKRRRSPRSRARYEIVTRDGRVSCLLLNSKGSVVNAINGGREDSEADVRRACAKHFPDAVDVERVPGKSSFTYIPGGLDGRPVVDTVRHRYRVRKARKRAGRK